MVFWMFCNKDVFDCIVVRNVTYIEHNDQQKKLVKTETRK